MEIKKMSVGLLCGVTLIVSACGGAPAPAANTEPEAPAKEAMAEQEASAGETMAEKAPTEEAMMAKEVTEEAMMAEKATEAAAMAEKATEEAMMEKATEETMMAEKATEEAMMEKEATDEAMMAEKATEEAMMAEKATEEAMAEKPSGEAMAAPAWFSAELTNVNSGETFKISDFKGKVVLVETMAVWCPLCQQQQGQIRALHELMGQSDDLISLSLDIDPNEDTEILQAHVGKNGFDWRYAVAPPDVAREIGQLYGAQFLNPPATPMFIIDRTGEVHPLPFGVKDAPTLQEALAPFLNEG